jgi:N-acetylglucosaminyldiphosphoundecaprenol N-acetyl-beta-D-mannosaminyltransferase
MVRIAERGGRVVVQMLPLAILTAVLLALLLIRVFEGVSLPGWLAWVIGCAWGLMVMEYLIRYEVLKQIGGMLIVLLAILILVGALVPLDRVERYPQVASDQLAETFTSTWDAVYQGQLFEHFSPKLLVIDALKSAGRINPFRGGKMVLFGLLGFLMAASFLFPYAPSHAHLKLGSSSGCSGVYLRRFVIVLFAGLAFAVHAEILQVLTATRSVTLGNLLENSFGILAGIVSFVPVQLTYSVLSDYRKKGSPRFNVLGVGVDAVNMDDCLAAFDRMINAPRSAQPAMTSALGVAGIIEARRNQSLQRILNQSELNTPDGMPLVWLGKLFGYGQIDRVYGPDLLRDVCAYSAHKGWTHYFYGSAPGVADKLKRVLEQRHPGIQVVGTYCPPFRPLTDEEEAELIADVARVKPDIFWVGISTPKQLYFMDKMRNKLACKIICPVGYAFDVNAGVEVDAPDWIKYAGLQWLHRALKQPRLWKRYVPDNPRFVWEVLLQLLRLKRYPCYQHTMPTRPFMDAEGYPRFPAGVVSLSALNLEQACQRILDWVKQGKKYYVNVCTADTMVQCQDQPELARVVQQAGMATTDGMPLVWLARWFGFKQAARVYGPDLMLEVCRCSSQAGRPLRHYFYGATEDTLRELQRNLKTQFPDLVVAGSYAPPFRPLTADEKDEVAERINQASPDVVWCGLGTPKQDYWVAEFRPRLQAAALIAVGAAFDFHALRIRQAPRWMMRSGLEWLFRLAIEPRRLWRRYVIGNPRFVWMIFRRQLLHGRRSMP